jgi:predicted nuclease of predicted toxin-antitoxin system
MLRLLVDENCAATELTVRLRSDGHGVRTSIEALGARAPDAAIFAYANAERRVIVTKDTPEHEQGLPWVESMMPSHWGEAAF